MHCFLEDWLDASYVLDDFETRVLDELHADVVIDGNYWNEEELKIEMIGSMFRMAKVKVANLIKVFYKRELSATVEGYDLGGKSRLHCCFLTTLQHT